MNPKLLLFLCCLTNQPYLYSQDWFQTGDSWTYDVTTGWEASNYGLHGLKVLGDSLVEGETWKKIRYRQITQPDEYFLAKASGNQVLARQLYGMGVHRVYNFDAGPGDTIRYSNNQAYYRVVDTSTVLIAGKWRKQQIVHFNDEPEPFQLLQGIGMTGRSDLPLSPNTCSFLLPNFPFCTGVVDGYDFRFRCFEDSAGNRYSPQNSCLQIEEEEEEEKIREAMVWPNPTTGVLQVREEIEEVKLYQINGTPLSGVQIIQGYPTRAIVPKLPLGMYLIEIRQTNGSVFRQRILYFPTL